MDYVIQHGVQAVNMHWKNWQAASLVYYTLPNGKLTKNEQVNRQAGKMLENSSVICEGRLDEW